MKAQLLVLSAAGLLLAVAPFSTAAAGPADVQRYVASATTDVGERLTERNLDLAGKSFAIRGRVQADRLSGVRIARSSGSAELDDQIVAALKNLRTEAAPVDLVGRELTLTLGEAASAVATR
ncbi:hypothetical protein ASE17_10825 [Phenylobacterium sp. Root77]|uniref:hypothetical protein n=1 Tax=unclassified Phenylobacterium TaxID=2640670 RepID=UPI0006F35C41|nr:MULTISPECIES: hypothetical protein [unclassified Phenylobacterium]KQW73404.1 hypothetical protein ASC73_03395 [Phenylobacterium sp. Root1277]KQW92623.1 hypothetical protein ASC79_14105 [Phenylobacterium sp. Root1290]KRC40851.1 hypothetical protein ASE17_10825 [Phenylobacterium sp. Root77]